MIVENEIVLLCVRAERVAAIERLRDILTYARRLRCSRWSASLGRAILMRLT